MRVSRLLICCVALAGGCSSVFAQISPNPAKPSRRALVVTNTRYGKLQPLPNQDRAVESLVNALRDAQFQVVTQQNLDLASFSDVVDRFQMSIQPGDISLVYYMGYIIQDPRQDQDTHLAPVEFDSGSKANLYDSTVSFISRLQQGIKERNPSLSLFLLDVREGTRVPDSGQVVEQPAPPARSWMFLSTVTAPPSSQPPSGIGSFTLSLAKAMEQPGLDLTGLASEVSRDLQSSSTGAPHLQVRATDVPRFYFRDPVRFGVEKMNVTDRLMYVYIPEGRFWMGCVPATETQCNRDEKPRHLVDISKGFWLGQTEVTDLAYSRYAKANSLRWKPHKSNTNAGKEGDLPVVSVSWEEAQAYCAWAAKGGRLPTEAEWEKGARDGKDDSAYPFADLASSRSKANFFGKGGSDIFEELAPVKQFDPSPNYRLYDMAGNVWEWCNDFYKVDYYQESPRENPRGPNEGQNKVLRGGAWRFSAENCRAGYRYNESPGYSDVCFGYDIYGFRCVRKAP